ncbi:NTP transferase domain-containing protein [Candidatus Latescibacterota bacterium]
MPQHHAAERDLALSLSAPLMPEARRIGIVLAAGHGKRIRSDTSKMLHQIWGKPTVVRVAGAVQSGLESPNQVIVVGIKAEEVMRAAGASSGRIFAYQESPVLGLPGGTGDAVRVALDHFPESTSDRDIFVFPGDMGLLASDVVSHFRREFDTAACDMMVLTGLYSGPPELNYYGRIVRVPPSDHSGAAAGDDEGRVIAIKEHRDILGLQPGEVERLPYRSRSYSFSREELLGITEINTLVVAFRERSLRTYIREMKTDNVQGELMLTDLVEILNHNGLVVQAVQAAREEDILAFNVKSVWRQMEAVAARRAYERLMDIVTVVDEEDFYVADEVIEQIVALDKKVGPLDIVIGKGVHLGPEVRLDRRVTLGDRCHLTGGICLGEGVRLGPGVRLSTYPGQTMVLGARVEVLARNILKGNLQIGRDCRIESGVIMTGSDEHPMRVGERVTVKGTSYLYGCHVDDDLLIEHSVIKGKHVQQVTRRDGTHQPIRYVLPPPEGLDSIGPLPD